MLTSTQLEKLEPLTRHPKYGKIVIDAIEIWKNSTPVNNHWGIRIFSNRVQLAPENKCCLFGAALVNKTLTESYCNRHITIMKLFNISLDEYFALMNGFDNNDAKYNDPSLNEAFVFGKTINKIVI